MTGDAAALLADPTGEFIKLDGELRRDLPEHLYESVRSWVDEACSAAAAPLWEIVGGRCERIGELGKQAEGNESAEQVRARFKAYFDTVNPGPIVKELQAAATLPTVVEHYRSTVAALAEHPTIGPVVRRYLVPEEVLRALAAACVSPLTPTIEALEVHARQIRAHGDLLRSLKESKGLKTGIGIAASIAGGLVLGRFGSVAARALTGAVMDSSAQMNESVGRVAGTFEQFRSRFAKAVEQVETNIEVVYLALYGGLLLRLQEDLNALGRTLEWLDYFSADADVALSEAESIRFLDWALSSLQRMDELAEQLKWLELGDAADKALRVTMADPIRLKVTDDKGEGIIVRFARHRATAINAVADRAWAEGRLADACKLYRHLLEGTNITWECETAEEGPDQSWSAARAGWRLAVAATMEPPIEEAAGGASIFPEYVAQALCRLPSDEPYATAPGEMLTAPSIMVGTAIARFAHDVLETDVSLGRVPERLRTRLSRHCVRFQTEPAAFSALDQLLPGTWLEGIDSSFVDWFNAGVEAARSQTHLRFALIVGGIIALPTIIFLLISALPGPSADLPPGPPDEPPEITAQLVVRQPAGGLSGQPSPQELPPQGSPPPADTAPLVTATPEQVASPAPEEPAAVSTPVPTPGPAPTPERPRQPPSYDVRTRALTPSVMTGDEVLVEVTVTAPPAPSCSTVVIWWDRNGDPRIAAAPLDPTRMAGRTPTQPGNQVFISSWQADVTMSSPQTRYQAKTTCGGLTRRSKEMSIAFIP